MTNKEWYLSKLNEMTDEELAQYLECEDAPWCSTCGDEPTCTDCAKKWFKETHLNPMPKLEIGMFVCCRVKYTATPRFGIIITQKCVGLPKHLCVAYQDGSWDNIDAVDIIAIYDAMCFNHCGFETCVWRSE